MSPHEPAMEEPNEGEGMNTNSNGDVNVDDDVKVDLDTKNLVNAKDKDKDSNVSLSISSLSLQDIDVAKQETKAVEKTEKEQLEQDKEDTAEAEAAAASKEEWSSHLLNLDIGGGEIVEQQTQAIPQEETPSKRSNNSFFRWGSKRSTSHTNSTISSVDEDEDEDEDEDDDNSGKEAAATTKAASTSTKKAEDSLNLNFFNDQENDQAFLDPLSSKELLGQTLEYVQDLYLNLRLGDQVLTPYGFGHVQQLPIPENATGTTTSSTPSSTTNANATQASSLEIDLGFGKLYTRQPEFLHKVLENSEYQQSLVYLEQVRKCQLALQCQDWGVRVPPSHQQHKTCVACLFQRPELYPSRRQRRRQQEAANASASSVSSSSTPTAAAPRRFRWGLGGKSSTSSNNNASDTHFNSSGSILGSSISSIGVGDGTIDESTPTNNNNNNNSRQQQQRHQTNSSAIMFNKVVGNCNVCGNPTCAQHKIAPPSGQTSAFFLCVDCSHDLNPSEGQPDVHTPQWQQRLDRLSYYYLRMALQLGACVASGVLVEISKKLSNKQRRDSQISLGTSGIGFIGAALGVAGAAAMLTPAGPAVLLAAVATSATSGTLQATHASWNMLVSNKAEANQVADRCLGWHGLCLGILQLLEQFRLDLLVENQQQQHSQYRRLHSASSTATTASNKDKKMDTVWNALAIGTYSTTRHGMTTVGVTSAMGASYSQAISTSLQGVPVVGAAFSVGCMAMDGASIYSHLKQLQQPSAKSLALWHVGQSFRNMLPNSIQQQVQMIRVAVQDLNARLQQQQMEEERRRIEQELEGL